MVMSKKRIAVILVDRANYGRLKPVMEAIRKQPALTALDTFNETLHHQPSPLSWRDSIRPHVFTQPGPEADIGQSDAAVRFVRRYDASCHDFDEWPDSGLACRDDILVGPPLSLSRHRP